MAMAMALALEMCVSLAFMNITKIEIMMYPRQVFIIYMYILSQ